MKGNISLAHNGAVNIWILLVGAMFYVSRSANSSFGIRPNVASSTCLDHDFYTSSEGQMFMFLKMAIT